MSPARSCPGLLTPTPCPAAVQPWTRLILVAVTAVLLATVPQALWAGTGLGAILPGALLSSQQPRSVPAGSPQGAWQGACWRVCACVEAGGLLVGAPARLCTPRTQARPPAPRTGLAKLKGPLSPQSPAEVHHSNSACNRLVTGLLSARPRVGT